jgi:DNA-binding XRE family transcriptional regulator
MTDTTCSTAPVVYGVFDGSRALPAPLTPADAGASGDLIRSVPANPLPIHTPSPLPLAASPPGDGNPKKKGVVLLDADVLRELRESKMLSQEEMANRFDVLISIATIKRAETWKSVRYRTAREFARFFGVPVETLLKR